MERLRIGLIGASRIAPQAVIAPAAGRDDAEVVAVAARDPARAQAFADRFAIPAVEPDYLSLLRRPDIDLIYVASPPALHAEHAIAALGHGKAVLCEKPFAMTVQEAEAMVAAGERAGRPLIEAFHYRFHPVIARLLDYVRSGRIGTIEAIEARFHTPIPLRPSELRWSAELGGGALMDLGCYGVHVARTLAAAEPEVIEAHRVMSGGVDVSTVARLRFPGGAEAVVDCSMGPDGRDRSLWVRGSAGVIELSNFVNPHAGATLSVRGAGVDEVIEVSDPTTYDAQLAHVVQVMQGLARPLTGGADAIANLRAMAAIVAGSSRQPAEIRGA
ncbi:MAG: Gfo/Idh/MocA family oxidoreductase [Caulobacteraceae bacterium]